jgi:hypothetical protein
VTDYCFFSTSVICCSEWCGVVWCGVLGCDVSIFQFASSYMLLRFLCYLPYFVSLSDEASQLLFIYIHCRSLRVRIRSSSSGDAHTCVHV